jgi:hypothetical protein
VNFNALQQYRKGYAMKKSSTVSLAPLAALLLAGSALAQTLPDPDANRTNRRCTSATLSTDASTPCPDDVRNGPPGGSPVVVRAPANSTAGSNTSTGTTSGGTGTASASPAGSMGAGSTGATGMRR